MVICGSRDENDKEVECQLTRTVSHAGVELRRVTMYTHHTKSQLTHTHAAIDQTIQQRPNWRSLCSDSKSGQVQVGAQGKDIGYIFAEGHRWE